jgi:hypothetical protein
MAATLAQGLSASIRVLAPQVVPYPLSLDAPQVSSAWAMRQFRTLAEDAHVDSRVEVLLCRDRLDALRSALPAASLVVVCSKGSRWWPSADKKLVAQLRDLGHQVVNLMVV